VEMIATRTRLGLLRTSPLKGPRNQVATLWMDNDLRRIYGGDDGEKHNTFSYVGTVSTVTER
jgi:hypothetical protein